MARGHRAEEILAALRAAPGGEAGLVASHAPLLEAEAEAEAAVSPPHLEPEEARARIERGKPQRRLPHPALDGVFSQADPAAADQGPLN